MDVSKSLQQGVRDLTSRTGVVLTLIFFASYLLIETVYRSLRAASYESSSFRVIDASGTYLFPDGPVVEGLISAAEPHLGIIFLVSLALPILPTLMAFRGFSGLKMLPAKRELGRQLFFLGLANLIALLGILFGSLFFVFPGVYIAVSLVFFPIFICVEGEGVKSLKSSWKLTKGNKIRLFGLLLVLLLVSVVPSFAAEHFKLDITSVYLSSLETVFGIAAVCSSYRQLKGEKDNG